MADRGGRAFISSQPEDLILLVGSNPLPNYLAARHLVPKRIHLLFTEETKDVRRRLGECLSDSSIELPDKAEYQLGDAADAGMIRKVAAHLPNNAGLNYTGGTKAMATHVHAQWLKNLGGKDSFASYLDDRGGQIRFDDGTTQKLTSQLDLKTLCKLHGLRHKERSTVAEGPTADEIICVTQALTNSPERVVCLYDRLRAGGKLISKTAFESNPLTRADLDTLGCSSLAAPIPAGGWKKDRTEAWAKILSSDWLEEYVALLVKGFGLSGATIHVGVNAWDQNHEKQPPDDWSFEADVLVVRDHKLYVISCTTDQTKKLCKGKLFEVLLRANQVGGGLVRAAVVSLAGVDKSGEIAQTLEREAQPTWDAPNKPRVFGLSHVRNWLAGNTADLREWLES